MTKRFKTSSTEKIRGDGRMEEKSVNKESSNWIEIQKVRAITQWEQAFSRKYFDENIYMNVLTLLQDKKVPPIFHTLCRDPKKRLFLPNTPVINKEEGSNFETKDLPNTPVIKKEERSNCETEDSSNEREKSDIIVLSADQVYAGMCSTSIKSAIKTIGQTDIDDVSYLDTFFTKDGQAFVKVNDHYLRKEWSFNDEISNIVAALVNTPAEMVGHDLEVTELHSPFNIDRCNGKNLITRSLSRGVVADCFEHSEPGSVYAIVGSQGIGKSWSLIYALQQALLYENACVLFFFQKVGEAWACIRKCNCIYVWTMHGTHLAESCDCDLFDNENMLVLLDPSEVSGASFIDGQRQLIFAASYNKSEQDSKRIAKITPHHRRILNPYSMEELNVALKYMSHHEQPFSNEEIGTMLDIAKEVGNVPRSILSSDACKVSKIRLHRFLNPSNWLHIKHGMDDYFDEEVLSSGIFSLYAFGSVSDDDYATGVPQDVGYDGDTNVDYGVQKIIFTNDYIKRVVAVAFRDYIMYYEAHRYNDEPAVTVELVKELFWLDMEKNITMTSFKLSNCLNVEDNVSRMDGNELSEIDGNEGSDMDGNKGSDMDGNKGSEMDSNEESKIDGIEELEIDVNEESEIDGNKESEIYINETSGIDGSEKTAIDENEVSEINFFFAEANDLGFQPSIEELGVSFFSKTAENMKCRMKKDCKLFHFAGPGHQLFHVTVRRNVPSMDFEGMKQLLIGSGILKIDSNGALYKKDVPARKLMFYWVVPFSALEDWKQRRAQTLFSPHEKDNDEEIVKECFNEFVDQFVVFMI